MLAWVVIFRPPAYLATLFRHVTKNPSPQVLVNLPLANCDARNPFRIRSYENCRVALDPRNIPTSKHSNLPTYSDLSLFLSHSCTLFCTHKKLKSFLFMRFRTLYQKPPGVGVPPRFFTRIKMNLARTTSCLTSDTSRCLHRYSTRAEAFPRLGFASLPTSFLVNYIDPILPRVGPAGHFPYSTQRPRS